MTFRYILDVFVLYLGISSWHSGTFLMYSCCIWVCYHDIQVHSWYILGTFRYVTMTSRHILGKFLLHYGYDIMTFTYILRIFLIHLGMLSWHSGTLLVYFLLHLAWYHDIQVHCLCIFNGLLTILGLFLKPFLTNQVYSRYKIILEYNSDGYILELFTKFQAMFSLHSPGIFDTFMIIDRTLYQLYDVRLWRWSSG